MSENKNPWVEKGNNIEAPKKRSFFWWNLDIEKKDFLDFRYNTQEEIDKLNSEMMTEDLWEIVTQPNKIENQTNINDENHFENSGMNDSENITVENTQPTVQSSREEINTNEELIEDDANNMDNTDKNIQSESEATSLVNDNQDLWYNEDFEWINDENDWLNSAKFFDPFELNFDDESETDIENDDIENIHKNEDNYEDNDKIYDEDSDENDGNTTDENINENINETNNEDELKNDEVEVVDDNKNETVDKDENNDDFETNNEDEIIDNNESNDENTIENNQNSKILDESQSNNDLENLMGDVDDPNGEIEESIEDKDIIENYDENNIDGNNWDKSEIKDEDENESESNVDPENDDKDKIVNDDEDKVVDSYTENNDAENNNENEIIDNNVAKEDENDNISKENDDIENHTEDEITDKEDDTESDTIEDNDEDITISNDEDNNEIWANSPFIPVKDKEDTQAEKTNISTRKKKKYSRDWKQITNDEIELEEWQDSADNENDDEYIPSDEEIFEQEPDFFADDELSKQFMKLVWNSRWIFRLERKNWGVESCFKIIGWKNTDTTLEYLFYLIEQPGEPLDLFIKKIERDLDNWEEIEHLVQFSYEDKKLNIFVDEIILYEHINNADDSSWEYRDTKAVLEKFIFLSQTYYDELESEIKRQQEEKQKKRQLQNIFKGF